MINGSFLVNDGLDTFTNHESVCLNNRHTAYTYNQGVILSGFGYLHALGLQPPPGANGSYLQVGVQRGRGRGEER